MRAIGYVALAVVVLIACYGGSYYAMVDRLVVDIDPNAAVASAFAGKHYPPWYRFGGENSEAFYSPCHAFDRWLRPKYWTRQ